MSALQTNLEFIPFNHPLTNLWAHEMAHKGELKEHFMTNENSKTQTAPATQTKAAEEEIPEISSEQLIKLALEMGPLIVFFITNWNAGIFWGTGFFMIATAIALTISQMKYGRIPLMPLVTGIFLFVFGSLTLWLQDDLFIKLKPTIANALFATILFAGLVYGKSFLKYVLGEVLSLSDKGWRLLTIRWALFFVFLAILNEFVWRMYSTDFWVSFKVFGLMPITFAFAIFQIGIIKKYELKENDTTK